MNLVCLLGLVCFALFVFVVALGFIPGVNDENGRMFGLFKLDLYDDALHIFSGLWAGAAALISTRSATIYFLGGVMGLFIGSGYLYLAVVLHGVLDLDWTTKIFASLPHLLSGGFAIFTGLVLAKPYAGEA